MWAWFGIAAWLLLCTIGAIFVVVKTCRSAKASYSQARLREMEVRLEQLQKQQTESKEVLEAIQRRLAA